MALKQMLYSHKAFFDCCKMYCHVWPLVMWPYFGCLRPVCIYGQLPNALWSCDRHLQPSLPVYPESHWGGKSRKSMQTEGTLDLRSIPQSAEVFPLPSMQEEGILPCARRTDLWKLAITSIQSLSECLLSLPFSPLEGYIISATPEGGKLENTSVPPLSKGKR